MIEKRITSKDILNIKCSLNININNHRDQVKVKMIKNKKKKKKRKEKKGRKKGKKKKKKINKILQHNQLLIMKAMNLLGMIMILKSIKTNPK